MPLTAKNLNELVEASNRLASEYVQKSLETSPPAAPLACKQGCAWCCYVKVDVTAAEVFRIVEHLRASLSQEQLEVLQERVVATDEATRDLSADERLELSVPCPLLQNDLCSVYPVRPMPCRGMNSTDADSCEESWREPRTLRVIPQHPVIGYNYAVITQGLCRTLERAGLDGHLLELNAALRKALETPNAVEQWLGGEPLFGEA
ncbi:MAG TPA: YkgJ family cysteine cluster protein, partial [Blastocatellia bacterium]|nr:YkgJ family cysteine cluster protein [Blastocatellia bacterium]